MFRLYFRENKGWGGERERREYNNMRRERRKRKGGTKRDRVREPVTLLGNCLKST